MKIWKLKIWVYFLKILPLPNPTPLVPLNAGAVEWVLDWPTSLTHGPILRELCAIILKLGALWYHSGSFFNYVDQILPNIDHLPTHGWHWRRNSFTIIWENLHTNNISSTTYLPCLVNVVKERPLVCCLRKCFCGACT